MRESFRIQIKEVAASKIIEYLGVSKSLISKAIKKG